MLVKGRIKEDKWLRTAAQDSMVTAASEFIT